MQLEFFPSRTLTAYLARLFVMRVLAVLVMLVLVLQTLDLLGESGKILGYPGNGQAQPPVWTGPASKAWWPSRRASLPYGRASCTMPR